jgi:hypothetical protein
VGAGRVERRPETDRGGVGKAAVAGEIRLAEDARLLPPDSSQPLPLPLPAGKPARFWSCRLVQVFVFSAPAALVIS